MAGWAFAAGLVIGGCVMFVLGMAYGAALRGKDGLADLLQRNAAGESTAIRIDHYKNDEVADDEEADPADWWRYN